MSVYGVMLEIYKRLLNECLGCDAHGVILEIYKRLLNEFSRCDTRDLQKIIK